MARIPDSHDLLIAKLARRVDLDEADLAAIRKLSITVRPYDRHTRLTREYAGSAVCGFIMSGYAIRSKMTATGGRQIVAFLQPGDIVDLQQIFLSRSDYVVEALSAIQIADVRADQLAVLAQTRPTIGRAIWMNQLVESSITRELLLNVGRRDGLTRVAHQLCEFSYRLSPTTRPLHRYEMPLTQEQLGDLLGLTGVHTNRMLKMLRERGLIDRAGRDLIVRDWDGLIRVAEFSPNYLNLCEAETLKAK